ncbi:box C/D snoRNA protein 1-like [Impatiens glandulifera]|uniref:box C/D snoRNA protein 1-like n=1 Tax=Impatiens glandulifera TaxID=253017 RepID=UPI001FB14D1E|nr:box C/D snoRNA protein 1-like [Impatiens glandulifera]
MEEPSGASVTADSSSKQSMACEECKLNPSKYKCPGCSLSSCSLPCVKAHKQRTGCTGKRQLTRFVPLSQFDDSLLLSDYHMLEETKRVTESSRRVRMKLWGNSHLEHPFSHGDIRKAALSRRTRLLFLPNGMSRRKENRSSFNYKLKLIKWTIEWRFQSTDVVLIDHGVDENATLRSVVEKHLKPGPWRHHLSKFCEDPIDDLKFLIRKFAKGRTSSYRELDIDAPIRHQFEDLVILEYPMIQVYLPSVTTFESEVIKDKPYNKPKTEVPVQESSDMPSSPKGVTFKEEEIQEEESPVVVPIQTLDNDTSDELVLTDLDFGLDQGLIDLYPYLVGLDDPIDTVEFNGVLIDRADMNHNNYVIDSGVARPTSQGDEAEEGEIPFT